MRARKVYLAGPDGFLPNPAKFGQRKKRLCRDYGFGGLYPFDNDASSGGIDPPTDIRIYRANIAMIQQADFAIVNLTPFRGPSADVGTVFEVGMLIALGKPVFGYTNNPHDMLTRLQQCEDARFEPQEEVWRDMSGMLIENFNNADNLMITSALLEQGWPIVRHGSQLPERFSDLTGFELCLRNAQSHFARADPGRGKPALCP